MQRYFIRFSYLGTQYRGVQKNLFQTKDMIHDTDTIQGALECAFSSLIPKCKFWPKITTSSRTDTGVHAFCNAAHIDIQNIYNTIYNPLQVLPQINSYLTRCHHDIRLLEFFPVNQQFHARFHANSRTYVYRFMIPKTDAYKMPITERPHTYCFCLKDFDIEQVKHGIKLFLGKKDFGTFSALVRNNRQKNSVRILDKFTIEKSHPLMPMDPLSQDFEFWQFLCSSKSFLYNQIRRMVSALLYLGSGYITEKDIICMLQVPSYNNWMERIHVVPPVGLHLINVEYSQEVLDKHIIKCKPANFEDCAVEPIDLSKT